MPALAAAPLVVLFAASASHAQTTYISNLSQPYSGLTDFNTTSDRYAQSFKTSSGSTNQFLFARLTMALQSTASASDTLHLYLYNNGSGTYPGGSNNSQPTTQFADLGTTKVSGTAAGVYAFSSSSRYSFVANTTYWLVLQDDANSNAGWGYTTSTALDNTAGATVTASAATGSSPDAGASWIISATTYTDPGSGTVNYGEQLFEFGTSNAALPEPDALPLLACGIVGFTLLPLARRSRRAIK